MLSSLGFSFARKCNDDEQAILARRGFEDGATMCKVRYQQSEQRRGGDEDEVSPAATAAATDAASAATSLVAGALSGGARNGFHEEELERMFYLAMRAEST